MPRRNHGLDHWHTQLGSLEITALLGKGGMGEVYRARDLKLKREVAIKILPEEFSRDPERISRFQREAEVLASLNHPNIAAIYDVQEASDSRYLVLELVEGETLAERIARGPIPPEEALTIAVQICEALESAHERGVVHRDLKPANVKITPAHKVKVLDFGLAKAMEKAPTDATLSNSPTLLSGTMGRMIIGTAGYMSPEQAKGFTADARSDVFSFGCVLYEMLTGKQSFHGETVSEIVASLLIRDPDFTTLPRNLNPRLQEVLQCCLSKNPRNRWHSAADIRIELEYVALRPYRKRVSAGNNRRYRLLALSLATVIAVAAALIAVRPSKIADEVRLDITTPATSDPISLAISPDGRRVAFVATQEGKSTLLMRELGSSAVRALPGTNGAIFPFWSPDGNSIGFFADDKLKRIDISGGLPRILAVATAARGGTWTSDGTIVYAPAVGPLYRIPAGGGERVQITTLAASVQSHRFPQMLPDGSHFLFYGAGSVAVAGVYVGSLDGAKPKRLVSSNTTGIYHSSGYLLFVLQGTLLAQRLDLGKLEVRGDPIAVADSVAGDASFFGSAFASANGAIVYRQGSGLGLRRLVWFDRTGKEIGSVGGPDPGGQLAPEISPDEKSIAVQRIVDGNLDVWVIDALKGLRSRLTSDPAQDLYPIWSPDGRSIVFGSTRNGPYNLYRRLAIDAGDEELLLPSAQSTQPADWSADGKFILYREIDAKNGYDLRALPTQGEDRRPIPVAVSSVDELEGQFSPNVRWVAYTSNFTGGSEIYIAPFGHSGGRQKVSRDGGVQPRWRHDGSELFYIAPDNSLMSVTITNLPDGELEAALPVSLFHTRLSSSAHVGSPKQQYAVSRDGQRFLMLVSPDDATPSPVTVILNWHPQL